MEDQPETPRADHRFSETLRRIEQRVSDGPLTLGEMLELAGSQGHAFLAIFLVLPFLQPIPLPGISSAVGAVLAVLGLFVALQRPPWLPRRFAALPLDRDTVIRISAVLERLLRSVEHVVRPRAASLFARRWFRAWNGTLWVVHAIVFSLPLPIPLSNAFPAVVILLLALGTVEEDLGVIVLGWVGAVANVLFFGGLLGGLVGGLRGLPAALGALGGL